jgi:hypothetical protein
MLSERALTPLTIRYLPAVRRATASGSLKLQLLLEMTARGIKNHLLHLLREAKRTLGYVLARRSNVILTRSYFRSMSEHSYRELIATACNKYLGDMNDQKTNETWDQLRARLRITFVDFPDDTELHNDLMEAPVKYQLAIEQGICPTIKWREPLIAPMQAWACKTCGIDVGRPLVMSSELTSIIAKGNLRCLRQEVSQRTRAGQMQHFFGFCLRVHD